MSILYCALDCALQGSFLVLYCLSPNYYFSPYTLFYLQYVQVKPQTKWFTEFNTPLKYFKVSLLCICFVCPSLGYLFNKEICRSVPSFKFVSFLSFFLPFCCPLFPSSCLPSFLFPSLFFLLSFSFPSLCLSLFLSSNHFSSCNLAFLSLSSCLSCAFLYSIFLPFFVNFL